jgi:hypothetical protein
MRFAFCWMKTPRQTLLRGFGIVELMRSRSGTAQCSAPVITRFSSWRKRKIAPLRLSTNATSNALVMKTASHWGVAVIPSGGCRDEQFEYILAIAKFWLTSQNASIAAKKFHYGGRRRTASDIAFCAHCATRFGDSHRAKTRRNVKRSNSPCAS